MTSTATLARYTHEFTRRMVDIDDGAIEVWEGGDGPVTFLTGHPFLSANGAFPGAGLTDCLAAIGRTVFVTPRGCGGSFAEHRREKLGMNTYVDDLEQVRRALGIEQVVPCGYSCGGMTTLMYAIRNPHALAGVVPVCTAASYHYAIQPTSLYSPTSAAFARLDAVRREHGLGPEYDWAMVNESVHNKAVIDRILAGQRKAQAHNEVVVEEVLVGKWNYEPELVTIKAPTLVVVSRYDGQAGSMIWSHKILVGIDGSELAVMNRSGHLPFEEEPEEFKRVVREFVDRRIVNG
jgi:proline iminopeptidase